MHTRVFAQVTVRIATILIRNRYALPICAVRPRSFSLQWAICADDLSLRQYSKSWRVICSPIEAPRLEEQGDVAGQNWAALTELCVGGLYAVCLERCLLSVSSLLQWALKNALNIYKGKFYLGCIYCISQLHTVMHQFIMPELFGVYWQCLRLCNALLQGTGMPYIIGILLLYVKDFMFAQHEGPDLTSNSFFHWGQ